GRRELVEGLRAARLEAERDDGAVARVRVERDERVLDVFAGDLGLVDEQVGAPPLLAGSLELTERDDAIARELERLREGLEALSGALPSRDEVRCDHLTGGAVRRLLGLDRDALRDEARGEDLRGAHRVDHLEVEAGRLADDP